MHERMYEGLSVNPNPNPNPNPHERMYEGLRVAARDMLPLVS